MPIIRQTQHTELTQVQRNQWPHYYKLAVCRVAIYQDEAYYALCTTRVPPVVRITLRP